MALLKLALQAVLKDEGFLLPSDSAKEAHLAASQMLEWLATNADLATHLAEALVTKLTKCVNCKKQGKMWGAFYDTRTSAEFLSLWRQLMKSSLGKQITPIFYQYVTTAIFKEVIKHQFPINAETGPAKDLPALTYEESNALRYAAGYVPRALRKRLEKGSHPLKEEIILCLAEMCGDEGNGEETDFSADWTKEVSRGGLK